jgi:HAD superfamily hydrolase (TIGR01509 family)
MPLRAIFFDFNGVLADDEPIHWQLFNDTLTPYGIHVSFQGYQDKLLGLDDKEVFRALLQKKVGSIDGIDLENLVAQKAVKYAKLAPSRVFMFPGILSFMKSLPKGLVCGIVSGALRSEVEMFLAREGLGPFFEFLVTAEDTPKSKPDPSCYKKAFDLAKSLVLTPPLKPNECLAIEDSIEGLLAAKNAGLFTLAVLNSYPATRLWMADWILVSFRGWGFKELETLLFKEEKLPRGDFVKTKQTAKILMSEPARAVLEALKKGMGQELAFVIGGGCCEGTTISLFEKDFTVGYASIEAEGPCNLFVESGWKHLYDGKTILVDVTEDDGSDRMSLEARLGKHFTFRIDGDNQTQSTCPSKA